MAMQLEPEDKTNTKQLLNKQSYSLHTHKWNLHACQVAARKAEYSGPIAMRRPDSMTKRWCENQALRANFRG